MNGVGPSVFFSIGAKLPLGCPWSTPGFGKRCGAVASAYGGGGGGNRPMRMAMFFFRRFGEPFWPLALCGPTGRRFPTASEVGSLRLRGFSLRLARFSAASFCKRSFSPPPRHGKYLVKIEFGVVGARFLIVLKGPFFSFFNGFFFFFACGVPWAIFFVLLRASDCYFAVSWGCFG